MNSYNNKNKDSNEAFLKAVEALAKEVGCYGVDPLLLSKFKAAPPQGLLDTPWVNAILDGNTSVLANRKKIPKN